MTYSIVSGNLDNAFAIDAESGRITVNNPLAINFERRPQYQLYVKVIDSGAAPLSATATLTINLRNLNDAPALKNEVVAVAENSVPGVKITKIGATDEDVGQMHLYSIVAGNIEGAFQIHPTSGQISVANAQPLDYEKRRVIRLIIRATDNGAPPRFGNAVVTVNITNLPD